jgi:hypothetical protein
MRRFRFHTAAYANNSASAWSRCAQNPAFSNSKQPFLTSLSVRFTVGYPTAHRYVLEASRVTEWVPI